MAKLIYAAIASLDGYVEDALGTFEWAMPDEEVFAYVNDLERPIGTYLYGRRMYETMAFWETASTGPAQPDAFNDFATLWRAADKLVYSRTLGSVTTSRTRVKAEFEPAAIRALKDSSSADLTVGGAQLAGRAFSAGLIDEFHLFLNPVLVGGGKRALPDGVHAQLELRGVRRFAGGVVHIHYALDQTRVV